MLRLHVAQLCVLPNLTKFQHDGRDSSIATECVVKYKEFWHVMQVNRHFDLEGPRPYDLALPLQPHQPNIKKHNGRRRRPKDHHVIGELTIALQPTRLSLQHIQPHRGDLVCSCVHVHGVSSQHTYYLSRSYGSRCDWGTAAAVGIKIGIRIRLIGSTTQMNDYVITIFSEKHMKVC